MGPQEKLAVLREYERQHINDIADAAQRGTEILMREIYTPKQDRIKKFADTIAERIDLHDPMLDIQEKKHISAYIKQKYRELGVPETVINHINDYLPDEYKNKALAREIEITANGTEIGADLPEVKKLDNLRLQTEDEKLAEEEKELKAKLARVRDVRTIIQEEASERHLSLPSMRESVVSTPKPKQRDTEFSAVLIDIANTLTEISRKVIEFPPSEEDAHRFAVAGRTYLTILKPSRDLKYTKDYRGWLETIKTFEEYGKHASATKNAIITPSGDRRPLTREQVGDKALEVLEGAIAMYNTDPLLVALADWHKTYVEPFVGQRKINLHGKLSERA